MTLVLIAFALIALVDLPPLLRQKQWRELAVFVVILALGLAMSIATILGAHLPSAILTLGKLLKMTGLSWHSQ